MGIGFFNKVDTHKSFSRVILRNEVTKDNTLFFGLIFYWTFQRICGIMTPAHFQ